MGVIGKGGVIRNLENTGGNTRKEWGDVRKMKKGIRLRLLLSKLRGGEGGYGEVPTRDTREEDARDQEMVRKRNKRERLERIEAARIEEEKAARIEVERQDAEEAARVSAERQAAVKEACIAADASRFKQRGNSPRIRKYRLYWRGGRPQQRRSATNHKKR